MFFKLFILSDVIVNCTVFGLKGTGGRTLLKHTRPTIELNRADPIIQYKLLKNLDAKSLNSTPVSKKPSVYDFKTNFYNLKGQNSPLKAAIALKTPKYQPSTSGANIKSLLYDTDACRFFDDIQTCAASIPKKLFRNVVFPPIDEIIGAIKCASRQIYETVNDQFDKSVDNIKKSIKTITLAECIELETVITNGNAEIIQGLENIFINAEKELRDIEAAVTENTIAEITTKIGETTADLAAAIQALFGNYKTAIRIAIEGSITSLITELNATINMEAMSFYIRLERLITDPTNSRPIYYQLVYPSITVFTGLVGPINNDLNNEIVDLTNSIRDSIDNAIDQYTLIESKEITIIINNNDKDFIARVFALNQDILAQVQKLVDAITLSEMDAIAEIITTTNSNLQDEVIKNIESISKSLEIDFKGITNCEKQSIATAIFKRNSCIIQQYLPFLTLQVPCLL